MSSIKYSLSDKLYYFSLSFFPFNPFYTFLYGQQNKILYFFLTSCYVKTYFEALKFMCQVRFFLTLDILSILEQRSKNKEDFFCFVFVVRTFYTFSIIISLPPRSEKSSQSQKIDQFLITGCALMNNIEKPNPQPKKQNAFM